MIKAVVQDKTQEIIIRQHRHWTRWMIAYRTVGEGNLVLTNHRLLFLHRIDSSPEVTASIRQIADAPIETVLNHALTLHKNCLQIPLHNITRVGIGSFMRFPFPYFYLTITYLKSRKQTPYTVNFQFLRPKHELSFYPQIVQDFSWMNSIKWAIRETIRM